MSAPRRWRFLIGASGYGELIFRNLSQRFSDWVICFNDTALFALILDTLLAVWATPALIPSERISNKGVK